MRSRPVILIAIGVLAVVVLGAARSRRIPIIEPKVIQAEDRATVAGIRMYEMDFDRSVALYEGALPLLADDTLHRRLYARALSHLGLWDSATEVLRAVSADSSIRGGVHADLDRLRSLDNVEKIPSYGIGSWIPLRVRFGMNAQYGPLVSLSGGVLAAANVANGFVTFWSTSGSEMATVGGLGKPVSIRADPANSESVWIADMAGDRVLHVRRGRGIIGEWDVGILGVHGVHDAVPDANGGFWAVDYGGGRVIRVSRTGKLIAEIGGKNLVQPTSLMITEDEIIVAESGKGRLIKFDHNGRLLRTYSHLALDIPVFLAAAGDGYAVQDKDGQIFWGGKDQELTGPAQSKNGHIVTSELGLAIDERGTLWWSDGNSFQAARYVPAELPLHVVEVIRSKLSRDTGGYARIELTASVMDRDGNPVRALDKRSFRLLQGDDKVLMPLGVVNLSEALRGRRLIVALESSDAVAPHRGALEQVFSYFLSSLTGSDKTAVLDIADSWQLSRDFTRSSELVGNSLMKTRGSVAAIDLVSFDALESAVRLLATTDYARGLLWVTSGEKIADHELLRIERMGRINQVPIFPMHIGSENARRLQTLAKRTGGAYYQVYSSVPPAAFFEKLGGLRSGRYRIAAELPLPESYMRGKWFDFTIESYFGAEAAFDDFYGYYWY